jgi:hypothetical protein
VEQSLLINHVLCIWLDSSRLSSHQCLKQNGNYAVKAFSREGFDEYLAELKKKL